VKTAIKWILGIIAVVLIAGVFLLMISPVPEKTSFNVTLEELRAIADQDKDILPSGINALNITDGEFASGVAVAGYFSPLPVPCYV
jgi:hypothetical protein